MTHATAEDTQVNTRINKRLKESGDATFEALGITPSQAIRGFYEFAARNRYSPEKVAEIINFRDAAEEKAREERVARRLEELNAGRRKIEKMLEDLGLSGAPWEDVFEGMSDKEILEQARYERAVAKGLI